MNELKFTVDIDINLPWESVLKLFDSTKNMYKWQTGLISFDHISGTPNEVGSKSKLLYKMGSPEIEMIETITVKKFQNKFAESQS